MKKATLGTFFLMLVLGFGINFTIYSAVIEDGYSDLFPCDDYVPDEVVVKFKAGVEKSEIESIVYDYGTEIYRKARTLDFYRIKVPEGMVPEKTVAFREDPRVEYAHPNYYVYPKWEPNDWYWEQGHLWNFELIGMPEAWDADTTPPVHGGDPSVVVAVIDTGVCYREYTDNYTYGFPVHWNLPPDLSQTNFWQNTDETPDNGIDDDGNGYIDDRDGYDFVNDDGYPLDDKAPPHGTHCTGTIAQSTNNDPGGAQNEYSAVGMAFNCTIMPLKIIPRGGEGANVTDSAEAITYAADNGAHVMSMSYGTQCFGVANGEGADCEKEAVEYAYEKGVVMCAATGNDAEGTTCTTGPWRCYTIGIGYPAGFPEVIGVGASDSPFPGQPETEARAGYSNYGWGNEITAPAGYNWYNEPENADKDDSGKEDLTYQQIPRMRNFEDGEIDIFPIKGWEGTSMATPHVAGLAALIISDGLTKGIEYTPDQVRNIIAYNAVDFNEGELPGFDYKTGFGRIDAAASLNVEPATLFMSRSYYFRDSSENGNRRAEPGEVVQLFLPILPIFGDAEGIQGDLSTGDGMIDFINDASIYPDAEFNNQVVNTTPFTFEVDGSCPASHEAEICLHLTYNSGSSQDLTLSIKLNGPNILVIDDDRLRGTEDYEIYFTEALDDLGIDYDRWETVIDLDCSELHPPHLPYGENPHMLALPSIDDLIPYDILIMTMGMEGQTKKRVRDEYIPLWEEFLDGGGRLFLSSHEFLYNQYRPDDGDTAQTLEGDFAREYLGIDFIEHDEYYYEVNGVDGDVVGDGLDLALVDPFSKDPSGSNPNRFDYWPDNFTVTADAAVIFESGPIVPPASEDLHDDTEDVIEEGPCAVRYPAQEGVAPFKTVFFAFPFEGICDREARAEVMGRILDWFTVGMGGSDPFINVAGYSNTTISEAEGGNFTMLAWAADPDGDDIAGVEIYYDGFGTGLELVDDGTQGDLAAGDGLFTLSFPISAGVDPVSLLLELRARDASGNPSMFWPYLTVTENAYSPYSNPWTIDYSQKVVPWEIEELYAFDVGAFPGTARPYIMAAGYMESAVSASQGGTVTILVVAADPDGAADIRDVEIFYGGMPTGVNLLDLGDGVFMTDIPVGPEMMPAGEYLLELAAWDVSGNRSLIWPYLTIE